MTIDRTVRRRLEADPTIQRMLSEIYQGGLRIDAEEAAKDPEKHKLSKVFPNGLRWRYFLAGKDGRGRRVLFAWSTTANAAGYYLAWRQVESKQQGKRDSYRAVSTSAAACRLSRQRMNEWKAEAGK